MEFNFNPEKKPKKDNIITKENFSDAFNEEASDLCKSLSGQVQNLNNEMDSRISLVEKSIEQMASKLYLYDEIDKLRNRIDRNRIAKYVYTLFITIAVLKVVPTLGGGILSVFGSVMGLSLFFCIVDCIVEVKSNVITVSEYGEYEDFLKEVDKLIRLSDILTAVSVIYTIIVVICLIALLYIF